jgi:hypothetical protein
VLGLTDLCLSKNPTSNNDENEKFENIDAYRYIILKKAKDPSAIAADLLAATLI